MLDRFRRDNLKFTDGPVEMDQASRQCDLAILNATSATTVAMLLAGKPALHIPIYLEQALTGIAAERLGAAISVSPTDPGRMVLALHALLGSDQYGAAARAFAARHADFDPERQIERLVDRADELATLEPRSSAKRSPATAHRSAPADSPAPETRPHVLLYTDDPGIGGVAQYNHTLLEALAGMPYKLTTVASRNDNPLLARQKSLGIEQRWLSFDSHLHFIRTLENK